MMGIPKELVLATILEYHSKMYVLYMKAMSSTNTGKKIQQGPDSTREMVLALQPIHLLFTEA